MAPPDSMLGFELLTADEEELPKYLGGVEILAKKFGIQSAISELQVRWQKGKIMLAENS